MDNFGRILGNFQIERYRQMNEGVRDSDSKRNIVVGFYITLLTVVLGLLSWEDVGQAKTWEKSQYMLLMLIIVGAVVAVYVTFARFWHCEYDRAAVSIKRMIVDCNTSVSVYEAAKKFKSKGKGYFNPSGTEFWIFTLVLALLSFNVYLLLIFTLKSTEMEWAKWFAPVPMILGMIGYKFYLCHKQSKFPDGSPLMDVSEMQETGSKGGQSGEKS